MQNEILTAIGK